MISDLVRCHFRPDVATIQAMVVRLCISAVLILFAAAQIRSAAQDAGTPVISVSVNLVKVPFSVFDYQGNLVADLRP